MDVSEIKQFLNLSFEDYLKLDGYSTSFLKRERNGVAEDFIATDKVRVGSLVDSILSSPKEADMSSPLYREAKVIAGDLRNSFGSLLSSMVPQISFTGIAQVGSSASIGEFKMPVKGRLDYFLEAHAVIDIKVTNVTNLQALIDFMRYKEQLYLYSRLAGVKKAYLFIYCVPKKKCFCVPVDVSGENAWWDSKVVDFGRVEEAGLGLP